MAANPKKGGEEKARPIYVKRVKKVAGGHHGGAWKVAYADFVTAMMAFFLVMWIGAQDQKTRQSVANYFVDPAGAAKKPSRTGAVLTDVSYGSVPKEQGSSLSRGRDSLSAPGEHSPATTLVAQWLGNDDKRLKEVQVHLDQCWDLLRQRRALRETGGDPSQAHARPADVVKKYIG